MFWKHSKDEGILIVSIYVDDLIYTGNNVDMLKEFRRSMKKEFDMTDLGKMRYFLGIEVIQEDHGIYISQRKYAMEVLDRFGMTNCNPVTVPMVPGCKLNRDE